MKILVFSDSHGNEDNMIRAVERERPSTLDAIVHLGDGWRDAEALHRLYPRIPLEQVPGNCDLGRFEESERVVFFGDCRVLLCHGHTLGVKSSLLRASYEARERGAEQRGLHAQRVPVAEQHAAVAEKDDAARRRCSTGTRTSRTSTTTMGCGSSIPAASATIAARPTGC